MNRRFEIIIIVEVLILLMGISGAWAAFRLSVKVDSANVRSGPGTGYPVLWKVEKYHPLKILRKSGDWYQFEDFEGDNGWIYKPLTDKTPTVITIKDKCNVRSGPDLHSPLVFQTGRGVAFRVLERKGKWIHIQHADGDKGWIHEILVW